MTTNPHRPGVLRSVFELEVSNSAQRDNIAAHLRSLIGEFTDTHPRLESGKVNTGYNDVTILVELRIKGQSFREADAITQNLIRSLQEIVDRQSPMPPNSAPRVEQMNQSLVPA